MANRITIKGQVTIPKQVRDALGLAPGMSVEFVVNDGGEVVLQRAEGPRGKPRRDRFEAVRGKADIKWRTNELMALLRGIS